MDKLYWKSIVVITIALTALVCFTVLIGFKSNDIKSTNLERDVTIDVVHTIDSDDFILYTDAFEPYGNIPDNYTCNGDSSSPPLKWTGTPDETQSFVVTMSSYYDTLSEFGVMYDWFVYNISKELTELPADVGNSSIISYYYGVQNGGTYPDKPDYHYKAPCSQGWGPRNYTYTIYALSINLVDFVPFFETDGYVISNYTLEYIFSNNFVINTAEITGWAQHLEEPADDPNAPVIMDYPPPTNAPAPLPPLDGNTLYNFLFK
mmetsp:Transcript_9486/g.8485  ORF Transcript_9486/g.8485 Transcript_9486/m.8485 type:complete len:262 (+) Transcript_9486:30-815(+)